MKHVEVHLLLGKTVYSYISIWGHGNSSFPFLFGKWFWYSLAEGKLSLSEYVNGWKSILIKFRGRFSLSWIFYCFFWIVLTVWPTLVILLFSSVGNASIVCICVYVVLSKQTVFIYIGHYWSADCLPLMVENELVEDELKLAQNTVMK